MEYELDITLSPVVNQQNDQNPPAVEISINHISLDPENIEAIQSSLIPVLVEDNTF